MNSRELLAEYAKSNPEHLARIQTAVAGKTEEQLNRSVNGEWSPYQVIDHLILSHDLYLVNMKATLAASPKGGDDQAPVRNTFLGKMIRKAAGPGGNAPAPKAFVPANGPFTQDVLTKWTKLQNDLLELSKNCAGRNLSSLRIPNPIVKVFKMNFVDCFQILDEHTERHVRQIEERVRA